MSVALTKQHLCGLQGFGAPGDRCPACEQTTRVSRFRLRHRDAVATRLLELEADERLHCGCGYHRRERAACTRTVFSRITDRDTALGAGGKGMSTPLLDTVERLLDDWGFTVIVVAWTDVLRDSGGVDADLYEALTRDSSAGLSWFVLDPLKLASYTRGREFDLRLGRPLSLELGLSRLLGPGVRRWVHLYERSVHHLQISGYDKPTTVTNKPEAKRFSVLQGGRDETT